MNISEAAKSSGLSVKTIRYYESIALIEPASRAANGYRDYKHSDVEHLAFLQRCRNSGFSIEQSRQLLLLLKQPQRHSADVKSLVEAKIEKLDQQLEEINLMRDSLVVLAQRCPGDESSQCSILNSLAEDSENE